MVSPRANTVVQLAKVKFFSASMDFPMSTLNDVVSIVAKGISTTITANSDTSPVSGTRQLRSSTTAGRTDLPDTVMYCFFASITSDMNRIASATAIRNTARAVASFRPCCPKDTNSTMRVVTVFTLPGVPMMEGIP